MSSETQSNAAELPKQYRPADHEPRIRDRWEASDAFHPDPARVLSGEARPYAIVIPPPNVTAPLHLGHALNNTLQDVLIRAHRMKGYETLWLPGADHAGIATQTVVEKRVLAEEGKRRVDFEREAFVEKIQAFKDEYEARILEQLKAMGCSCDWERYRFTMDDVCARAVREAFFRLFKDGLIYRGKRLVNWDPVTLTALADDEVEMKEIPGKFYYLRYPLVHAPENPDDPFDTQPVTWSELAARGDPGAGQHPADDQAWVTVETTRSETYLGDTGVAINPHDPRAKSLRDLRVQLPLVGRVIPIVEDDYVVMPDPESAASKAKYATGVLKVTPAHDPNDWLIGQRHDLGIINVMAPDAPLSDAQGWEAVGAAHLFVGLTREAARERVIKEFAARTTGPGSTDSLLEEVRDYAHSVGHSYRSHVPVEPYLSDQWYCKVTDNALRGEAQRALPAEQRSEASLDYDNRDDKGPGAPWPPSESNPHDGATTFHPARYAKTYEAWHDNLRDWCISRQLWGGHQIPVWNKPVGTWREFIGEENSAQDAFIQRLLGLRDAGDTLTYQLVSASDPATPLVKPDDIQSADDMVCVVCTAAPSAEFKGETIDLESWLTGHGFTRDPDVLDTWFSSALWPMNTMGWPDPAQADTTCDLLQVFNPTSVLCTGRDIITLWVSRMVMFNRYFNQDEHGHGKVPFEDVYIHPIIQDGFGQRMSKSLGNGVDPTDIIHSHGADALRYVLCQPATATQDVRLPVDLVDPHTGKTFEPEWITSPAGYKVAAPTQTSPSDPTKKITTSYGVASGQAKPTPEAPLARNSSEKFDIGRNFGNKVWNAARFAIGILTSDAESAQGAEASERPLIDRWMLSRHPAATDQIDDALAQYHIANPAQRAVLRATRDALLRLLHPVGPFLTETIYETLRTIDAPGVPGLTLESPRSGELLCTAAWPDCAPDLRDPEAESRFDRLRALVAAAREVRAKHNVPPKRRVTLHLPAVLYDQFTRGGDELQLLETLVNLEAVTPDAPTAASAPFTFESAECQLSNLADAVDEGAERQRLTDEIAHLDKSIAALTGRLSNPGYTDKAPAHLVQQTRDQLDKAQADRAAAQAALERLA